MRSWTKRSLRKNCMNNKVLWVIPLLFSLLFSCKRPAVRSVPLPSPAETASDDYGINVKNVEFDYFRSRSKITYSDPSNNQTVTADIRIKRDSVIWLSVSKLGIEGARGLITQDSIFLLDRLNNQLQVFDYQSLSKKFNIPISFSLLQSAILGNVPVNENPDLKIRVTKEKDLFLLRQNQDSVVISNYISQEDLKLKKIVVIEKKTNNSLNLEYSDFSALNSFLFPYSSLVTLDYQSAEGTARTVVTIQHTKAEISDKDIRFPFVVPPKYERKR